MATKLRVGQRVRFLGRDGELVEYGVTSRTDGAGVFIAKVPAGSEGTVHGPWRRPGQRLRGWWLIKVNEGFVPVMPAHVEAVS